MLKTIKGIYKDGVKEHFLAAAGSWSDLDTEKLKADIYKNREMDLRSCAQ